AGKGDERACRRRHHVGGAGPIVVQIPAGIGRQRYRDFGHPNARNIVAIGIHLWHESRKRRAELRRFLADDTFRHEVRTIVGAATSGIRGNFRWSRETSVPLPTEGTALGGGSLPSTIQRCIETSNLRIAHL